MEKVIGYIGLYLFVLLLGFPFLFFCVNGLWCLVRRNWEWDKKHKLLVLNAVIYPLVLWSIFMLLVKVFGVDKETGREIDKMAAYNAEAIRRGGDPNTHNAVLGMMVLGGINAFGTLIPTTVVAFVYSVISTALIIFRQAQARWWPPFLISGIISLAFILVAFVFRTPIFNWLNL